MNLRCVCILQHIGGHLNAVKNILNFFKKSVDVNLQDVKGETALIHASKEGHDDVVKVMMDSEIEFDLNKVDEAGDTGK